MFRRDLPVWMRSAALIMLMVVSASCTWSLAEFNESPTAASSSTAIPGSNPTALPVALAEVTFTVSIPTVLNPGESLTIGILDEVTGLGLNPVFYAMTAIDDLHFTVKLPFTLNSVIKYRYYRQGTISAIEDDYSGNSIRYRLFHVSGPASTDDVVTSWSDTDFSGGYGKIDGVVIDNATSRPIPNILVSAGGQSTLTDTLGQYIIEGLPAGTHMLSAYSLDGAYSFFQQGASVAIGLVTTAPIQLNPVPFVNITFRVSVPTETVTGAPVRIAGNLLQLGNTFADLKGGVSTIWSRMPVLSAGDDGRLSITLRLPAGADLRYKYTLGDGFWNAEHSADETFLVRQIIIPDHDMVIQDSVSTWQAGKKSAPILFDVTVPANTPVGETVSIQFKPFGWTESLPMWSLGNNHWVYKLYSPLNMLGSFSYRYCRNDQCGDADDVATAGPDVQGRQVSTSLLGENIQESVAEWQWWPEKEPGALVAIPVVARSAGFWAGAELSPNYSPGWLNLLPAAVENIKGFGSNFIVIRPGWTVEHISPLNFAPIPGKDPLFSDVLQTVQTGKAQNLNVAIFAAPEFSTTANEFWAKAPKTPEWWNAWFDRYRAFAIYHADLAAISGSQALILGGDEIIPSLPSGTLMDGSPSNVPVDAEARWRNIITEVQQHYSGLLLWAHPYDGNPIRSAPAFIDQFYAVYLLWRVPLSPDSQNSEVDSMTNNAVAKLDSDIVPFLLSIKKGVVLAIDYPSANGVIDGCIAAGQNGGCLDPNLLSRPNADVPDAKIDLADQSNLYEAMLQAVNLRDWVGGFISRGYYPPLPLMDKSSSVRGKPATDLLWYWFPRFLGVLH